MGPALGIVAVVVGRKPVFPALKMIPHPWSKPETSFVFRSGATTFVAYPAVCMPIYAVTEFELRPVGGPAEPTSPSPVQALSFLPKSLDDRERCLSVSSVTHGKQGNIRVSEKSSAARISKRCSIKLHVGSWPGSGRNALFNGSCS